MRDQIAAGVDDGDIHRLADVGRLLLGRGDDSPGVAERDHGLPPRQQITAEGGAGGSTQERSADPKTVAFAATRPRVAGGYWRLYLIPASCAFSIAITIAGTIVTPGSRLARSSASRSAALPLP